jgi:hypothetical protein
MIILGQIVIDPPEIRHGVNSLGLADLPRRRFDLIEYSPTSVIKIGTS